MAQPPTAAVRMLPTDFEIIRKLGEGACSKVYLERRINDGSLMAVKVLRRLKDDDQDENLQRIIAATNREMRILLMCTHPHIVSFFATMKDMDENMYVMEYCDGGDLSAILKKKGVIPLAACRHITAEISSGLYYLHEGEKKTIPIVPSAPLRKQVVIHRDLKPDNVMMTQGRHVKLIDFGSASSPLDLVDAPVSNGGGAPPGPRATTFVGTMHYMSPELVRDSFTTPASDYWALGIIVYEMLTGKRPFDGPPYPLMESILNDPPTFPKDFDADAKDLILQLLHKDHEQRLQGLKIRDHPFFSGIGNWDTLHTVDTASLWIRTVPWAPNEQFNACHKCKRGFIPIVRNRHHCRSCGLVFCGDCSSKHCIIPDSTYKTAERVCDFCFDNLS